MKEMTGSASGDTVSYLQPCSGGKNGKGLFSGKNTIFFAAFLLSTLFVLPLIHPWVGNVLA